jgi:endo-1,4-beta-D-glucanase Y
MSGAVAIPLTAGRSEAATLLTTVQAEAMTNAGGCTALQDTGAVYYCNNDSTYTSYSFDQAGRYSIRISGASSASNTAGISVLVDGAKVAAITFTGTAYTTQSTVFDVATSGAKEIRLKLETDNGQNDTYVDSLELYYEGETPPPPPAPNPPSTGAFASGIYRNLFKEWDPTLTDAAITAKLDAYWTHFFTGTDDTGRLYYAAGSNSSGALAYIKDTGNNDVRSEGMSYGMMIAVQMNRKAEFDALWNWAKTYMQHKTGVRTGYFCWQADFSGSCRDNNPASDGEEYFATALFFAGHRWGNGTGIYNYTTEANAILDTMLHKEDINGGEIDSVTNMFNHTETMIVFVPYASASKFSDPSYHLPAFYELWARWATGWNGSQVADRQFWREAATRSRRFFAQASHPTTGLNPDYAEFNGAPNNTGNHGDFRFDAWRTSVNWAVDYSWWAADANAMILTDRLQAFFDTQGINAYANQYSLAGSALSSDRSPGLIASNGAASLSATNVRAWKFVEALWNLQPSTGQYRYYDGLLNFMGLLHASGNFRIHQPGNTTNPSYPASTTAPATPPNLAATATVSATSNRNPYQQIEAESYDTSSGVTTESADGGTAVTFSGSGSYLVLNNLDFGSNGAGQVQFRVATDSPGVSIQVRIGSTSASPACTVYPDGNGTWHLKANSCYPKPAGSRNIYITTTGAARINHLTFGA